MLFAVLATAALVVDVGHAMVIQRELQASADAAALAAANRFPEPAPSTRRSGKLQRRNGR